MNWDDPTARFALVERVGAAEYNRQFRQHIAASTIDTVNGHAIRPTQSRFGRLFMVGNTGDAFYTLAEAKAHAGTLKSGS